jgi:hypothetical protein
MPYFVGVRLPTGEIGKRYAENLVGLVDVTDDGDTVCVVHSTDDFPFTADMCNVARASREYWRRTYAAAGARYPE